MMNAIRLQYDSLMRGSRIMKFPLSKPLRGLGEFFAMSLDTFLMLFRPPFPWREYLSQTWFVARVGTVPALMLTIPYSLLITFTIIVVLTEIGAADYSGTGASIADVNQIAPVATVLAISGVAASAICADLGARTIREEVDALRTMGLDPIRALVLPRVLATTTVALVLASSVIAISLINTFFFAVYGQHVSAGAFVDHLTLLTGIGDVIVSLVKATLFGIAGGLIACYKGLSVAGGPAGVGNAVNETVVYCFLTTFSLDAIVTAVGIQLTVS